MTAASQRAPQPPIGTVQVVKSSVANDVVLFDVPGTYKRVTFYTKSGKIDCTMTPDGELEIRAILPLSVRPQVTNSIYVRVADYD